MSNCICKPYCAGTMLVLLLLTGCTSATAQNADPPSKPNLPDRLLSDEEIDRQCEVEAELAWPQMRAKLEAYAARGTLDRLHQAKVHLVLEESNQSGAVNVHWESQ